MCGILVTKRPERGQMIKHRGTESHSFMDTVNEIIQISMIQILNI